MKKKALILLLAGMTVFSLGASSMAEDTEKAAEEAVEEMTDDGFVDYEGEDMIDIDEDLDVDALYAELEEMAADPVELSWEDYEEEVKKHEDWAGEFALIEELGLKLYIPEGFQYTQADEEGFADGHIGSFEKKNAAISIDYIELEDEEADLLDYAAELYIYYGMDLTFTTINGIDSFLYTFDEEYEDWLEDEEFGEYEENEEESDEFEEETISEDEAFADTFATLVIPAEDGVMIEITFSPFDAEYEDDLAQMMTAILASLQDAE